MLPLLLDGDFGDFERRVLFRDGVGLVRCAAVPNAIDGGDHDCPYCREGSDDDCHCARHSLCLLADYRSEFTPENPETMKDRQPLFVVVPVFHVLERVTGIEPA